jgi:outer membrane receptor protein involved in Fe transport
MTKFGVRLSAILLLGCAWPAAAQVEPTDQVNVAEGRESDDIIVTARKREESLQDVPLSISVVTAESIQRANLDNVSDLAFQTPGFSFRQGFGRIGGGGGAGVRPSIRGMSSVVGAPNAAFFVDGVFVSDNIASYQLDNLERVEVIKGPQSALFGRQTFSGAINYVTRRPGNEYQGRVRATVAQYDNYEISGYISGPIIKDVLKAEINGRWYRFGGDYVNADSGERDLGDQRSTNIGGRLLFTPSSNFEAIASIGYNLDRDKGYIYNFQGSARNNCFAPVLSGVQVPFPRTATSRRGFYCGEVRTLASYSYNNNEIEAAGFNGLDREFIRASLSMTVSTDSGFSLTSITAYNRNESITGQDNTLLPSANPAFAVDALRTRDFSQELRVMTPSDKPIRALIGGYYYQEDNLDGFQFTNTNRTRRPFESDDGVRSKSVFGMIEADLTDRFTVSAEARYQDEEILGSTEVLGVEGTAAPAATGQRKAQFDAFLPRVTARYEFSPDLNVYGSAAKGNKPGGFNAFPVDASAGDIASFTQQGFDVFDEETAWSYELGVKGQMGRINFAIAGFYTDWKQQQLSRGESYTRTNGTPNSVVFIQNAGASEIKGFEVELNGNLSREFFFRLGYTFVDARFTSFYDDTTEEIFDTDGRPVFLSNDTRNPLDVDGPAGGDLKGNFLPQTPRHQAIATGQLTLPVSDRLNFVSRADLAYESRRFSQVDNLNWAGDSFNLNASLGIESDAWTISLFARNLLDDRTPLVVSRLLDFNRLLTRVNPLTGLNQTTFFRDFSVSAPRRRQFGVNLAYKF